MKYLIAALAATLAIGACGQGDKESPRSESDYSAVSADMAYAGAPAPAPPPPPPPPPPSPQMRDQQPNEPPSAEPGANVQYIAYSYRMGLRLPVSAVEPVMKAHITACEAAGTTQCIVTNSNLNKQSDEYVAGNLYLRATPDWIDTFQGGIDAQVADAKGEITNRNKSAQDLTRAILDTDARLNAQLTLQTRLEGLLARKEGSLADLLAIERELARVTGDIESIKSNLKAMRLRVSMSDLSINYEPKQAAFSTARPSPLGEAFGSFFGNMASAIASVINFFAFGLPWMIMGGIFIFIWLRLIWPFIRKRRTKA